LVTVSEVLEQLDLPNLKKIAKRLGIQVSKGITGYFMQQQFGIESRRPYINALSNSGLVTLKEIDRILKTHYSQIAEEEEDHTPRVSERPQQRMRRVSEHPEPANAPSTPFASFESAYQFILERLNREDLQDICDDLDVPVSGNKADLVFRILGHPSFGPQMALGYTNKDGLRGICQELGLRDQGTREELAARIVRVITNLPVMQPLRPSSFQPQEATPSVPNPPLPPVSAPKPIPQPPQPSPQPSLTEPTQAEGESPNESIPQAPPSTPVPEYTPPQIDSLHAVMEFLDSYRPNRRYQDEDKYEIELATKLEHRFGPENVRTERNIPGGRIDIEVLGVGVELKVPTSRAQLYSLEGQAGYYQRYYGPNLAVLVINESMKYTDVNEFVNKLRDRGIQVFVK
jgi:hypothetical protein